MKINRVILFIIVIGLSLGGHSFVGVSPVAAESKKHEKAPAHKKEEKSGGHKQPEKKTEENLEITKANMRRNNTDYLANEAALEAAEAANAAADEVLAESYEEY